MIPDPTTIAFIALGANEALRTIRSETRGIANRRNVERVIERHEGQLGFISAVIAHAARLDEMGQEAGDALAHAVFAYEVAEEFGAAYATALLTETGEEPEAIMASVINAASVSHPA